MFVSFGSIIFFFGVVGMFTAKHLISFLLALELLLLALLINFGYISLLFDIYIGQIIGLVYLTIGAAESALGLAMLISYYRISGGISIDFLHFLKG